MGMSKAEAVSFMRDFYQGKKVFLTGIQGFKGGWLTLLLRELGATVVGAGLQAPDGHLFDLLGLEEAGIKVHILDVRERSLVDLIKEEEPDVLFHMAAQPIVSEGYADPYYTYSTNVMGVVNFLDGIRALERKCSAINVTTDKVFLNVEKEEPYREDDRLMGADPYSSSKSCSELVTYSYNRSFFDATLATDAPQVVSSCRAGNVIGGGDFALNRIVPDLVRAMKEGTSVTVRNFDSVRPYEHVLDGIYPYALLAAAQYGEPSLRGAYNIGPNHESVMKTREIVDFFSLRGGIPIVDGSGGKTFHEANLLTLDSGKFRRTFSWEPTWATKESMLHHTFTWYEKWVQGEEPMQEVTLQQIREFLHE